MKQRPTIKIILALAYAGLVLTLNLATAEGHVRFAGTDPLNVQSAAKSRVSRHFTGEYPESVGARCSDVPYGKGEARAMDTDESPEEKWVTSPNPDGPTVVDMGVFVESLDSVDESANTYSVDGFIDLIWCDSRLKFNTEEKGTPAEIYLEKDAEDMLGEAWWPDLAFKNETEPHKMKNVELTRHADGTMEYRAKFTATIGTDFALKAFPFDHQQLHLVIDSFTWAGDALVFRQQKNMVGFSDDFSIPEWNLVNVEEEVSSKKEIRDRSEFSTFTVNMNIDRDPGVYLTKVIFPLAAIVLLNMVVLWMRPDEFEARFGAAMSGLLAAVAYQFIASGHLPRHVYNTYIDAFVGLSFIVLLLIIAESGWVSRLALRDLHDRVKHTEHIARLAIPMFYIGAAFVLYLIYVRM